MGDNWYNPGIRQQPGCPLVEDEFAILQAAIDEYLAQGASPEPQVVPNPVPVQPPSTSARSSNPVVYCNIPGLEFLELPPRNLDGSFQYDFTLPSRAYNFNAVEESEPVAAPPPESRQEEKIFVPTLAPDIKMPSYAFNVDAKPFKPAAARSTQKTPNQGNSVPAQNPGTNAGMLTLDLKYYPVTQASPFPAFLQQQGFQIQPLNLCSNSGELIQIFKLPQTSNISNNPVSTPGLGTQCPMKIISQLPFFQNLPHMNNATPKPEAAVSQSSSAPATSCNPSHILLQRENPTVLAQAQSANREMPGCSNATGNTNKPASADFHFQNTPGKKIRMGTRTKKRNPPVHRIRQGPFCKFCASNSETPEFSRSHNLKDVDGKVRCPILRKYVCPFCNATGDEAHTRRYCPTLTPSEDDKPATPYAHTTKFCINSAGKMQFQKF